MALFSNGSEAGMAQQNNGSVSDQINMVGEGTVLEGTLRAQSDVRVSGRIVGQLHVEGRAIVAPEGVVEGEVTANDADVAGHVEGELHVAERLVLKETARVDGSIVTDRLIVEEGALFSGDCAMGEATSRPEAQGEAAPALARDDTEVLADVEAPAFETEEEWEEAPAEGGR